MRDLKPELSSDRKEKHHISLLEISLEFELLLSLIRLDGSQDGRISELLRQKPDWDLLRQLAFKQDILPLVYRRLCSLPEAAEGIARWRVSYFSNAKRNLFLTKSLTQVLEVLSGAGIPAIALKGPILALVAYGDLSLRAFIDLDILVRPHDFPRAAQALMRAGWSTRLPDGEKEQRWLLKSEKDLSLQRRGDLLELHWNIAERSIASSIDPENWWRSLQAVRLLNRGIPTLSAENTFLFLCLHGVKHRWQPLKCILDLAYYVNAIPDLDWSAVSDLVRRYGLQRGMSTGLILAERYCGLAIPGPLRQICVSDPYASKLAGQVNEALLSDYPAPDDLGSSLFYLNSRERLRDRLYFIFDQAFIPKQADWLQSSLPAGLYPLYYLLRPVRLFFKFLVLPLVAR